jgi:hypothetical protein
VSLCAVPDLANRPRQFVERIDEDLGLHAKKKKLLRLADNSSWRARLLIYPNCSSNCANSKSMTSN